MVTLPSPRVITPKRGLRAHSASLHISRPPVGGPAFGLPRGDGLGAGLLCHRHQEPEEIARALYESTPLLQSKPGQGGRFPQRVESGPWARSRAGTLTRSDVRQRLPMRAPPLPPSGFPASVRAVSGLGGLAMRSGFRCTMRTE